MKLGTDNKRKAIIAYSLGGVGLLLFIWQFAGFFTSTPQPAPAPAPQAASAPAAKPAISAGHPAPSIAQTGAQYDPTLRMDAMLDAESLEYSGSGRNIFSPQSAPVVAETNIPKPAAPAAAPATAH